jgi:hypothetical protein
LLTKTRVCHEFMPKTTRLATLAKDHGGQRKGEGACTGTGVWNAKRVLVRGRARNAQTLTACPDSTPAEGVEKMNCFKRRRKEMMRDAKGVTRTRLPKGKINGFKRRRSKGENGATDCQAKGGRKEKRKDEGRKGCKGVCARRTDPHATRGRPRRSAPCARHHPRREGGARQEREMRERREIRDKRVGLPRCGNKSSEPRLNLSGSWQPACASKRGWFLS